MSSFRCSSCSHIHVGNLRCNSQMVHGTCQCSEFSKQGAALGDLIGNRISFENPSSQPSTLANRISGISSSAMQEKRVESHVQVISHSKHLLCPLMICVHYRKKITSLVLRAFIADNIPVHYQH